MRLLSTSCLLLAATSAGCPEPAEAPRAPVSSVVVVTIDTTRADHLEPYGAEHVKTPTLAALAKRGVTFDTARAVAPVTLVAHSSILTGLYPTRHGVRDNGLYRLDEAMTSLPEQLTEDGWRTAAFVSAAVLARRYGLDQGFEVYDDDLSTSRMRLPRMVADRPAEATVDAARAWLDEQEEAPFFLWVHLYDPHAPYAPPERDPAYLQRPYDGEIHYMDAQIGRLFEHPAITDQTLVMVIGDHGESLGEHGEQTHGILAYDGTMRVPWLMAGPGVPAGRRVGTPVSQVDLVPTVLGALGRTAPDVDGVDLGALWRGEGMPPRVLYGESYLPVNAYGWSPLHVAQRGRWKLIEGPDPELYDLERDPRELTNVLSTRPDMAELLGAELDALRQDTTEPAPLAADGDVAAALHALGYVAEPAPARQSPPPDPKAVIHTHVQIERARQLAHDRLFDLAEKQLEKVLDVDPDNVTVWLERATLHERQGHLDRAVETVGEALARAPQHSSARLMLAHLELRRGKPDQALTVVQGLLENDRHNLSARAEEAVLLAFLNRRAEARAAAAELLTEFGDHPTALFTHARVVHLPDGDLAAATAQLEAALAKDPFQSPVWHLLGEVHQQAGQHEDAVRAWRKALEHRPDAADTHGALGRLLAHLGHDGAEAHLREALRLSPEPRHDMRVMLGAWLAERGRFEEAERAYAVVLANDPSHPAARNNRAIAWYRSGKMDEAAAELRELVTQHPRYADAHANLAAVQVDQGAWDAAARSAKAAIRLSPGMFAAWNNLGIARDELGDTAGAIEAYETALGHAPTYLPAQHNLGVALTHAGRHTEASEAFRLVLSHNPAHADAHLELARVYQAHLERPQRAIQHLHAFLRHGSGHPERAEATALLRELQTSTPGGQPTKEGAARQELP